MKKTQEDVYNEVINYINGKKHNKPCMLQSIKKDLRTPEIIKLIFDNPKVFNLDAEFVHIPEEYLTEELIMKFILLNPKRLSLYDDGHKNEIIIPEDKQTLPVLVSFECSKRRYEYLSRRIWGSCYEKVRYSAKTEEYKNLIIKYCKELEEEFFKNYSNGIFDASIEELIDAIKIYCSDKKLATDEKYNQKYKSINVNCDKQVVILVSGAPDSGKSTFAKRLSSVVGGFEISSDFLFTKGMLESPLAYFMSDHVQYLVFSDTDAYRFFSEEELVNYIVINIVIKPLSYVELHRHSKYNVNLDLNTHIENEIKKYRYDQVENPIIVTNDYTDNIIRELDNAVEQIINRLKSYKDDQVSDELDYSKKMIKSKEEI